MRPLANLWHTIAPDNPGGDARRRMAGHLIIPLIPTGGHGEIVVFHDNTAPAPPEGCPHTAEDDLQDSSS